MWLLFCLLVVVLLLPLLLLLLFFARADGKQNPNTQMCRDMDCVSFKVFTGVQILMKSVPSETVVGSCNSFWLKANNTH
jgi:hypothetical protein